MRRPPSDPITRRLRRLGVPDPAARRLALAGTPIDLDARTELCQRGARGTEAFLLVEGEAVVELDDGRQIAVGPGAVIGELAVLDTLVRRNATVRTTSPCLVLVYDVRTFRSLAAADDLRSILAPRRDAAATAA
jgi:CRP-like cAMP-binding protein